MCMYFMQHASPQRGPMTQLGKLSLLSSFFHAACIQLGSLVHVVTNSPHRQLQRRHDSLTGNITSRPAATALMQFVVCLRAELPDGLYAPGCFPHANMPFQADQPPGFTPSAPLQHPRAHHQLSFLSPTSQGHTLSH